MTKDEALKLALEAFGEIDWSNNSQWQSDRAKVAIATLKEALAQPEQEPVAWRGYNWGHSPDDWVYRDFDDPILDGNGNNVGQPLYTTPPQRTWIGLTDGEVDKMILLMGFPPDWITENAIVKNIVRNLEAKLKEKNT